MDEPDFANKRAPTRDYIDSVDDIRTLVELISEATDIEIAIETQLDYYLDDAELKGRRVSALIFWRQAIKNAKFRIRTIRTAAREAVG